MESESAACAKDPEKLKEHSELLKRLVANLETVIRGKRDFLSFLVTCLVAGGHVLIEDLPGLGKTTVAKTLARLIADDLLSGPVSFRRIQFTPDLLPYDITGVDIFDPETKGFVFAPGPVFANIVLADEINRTTPKVQSALLEVMAEHQVTVGNKTHTMDEFFFVIATQNPIEIEGTYPLPIAQIDRFLMRLCLGYPDLETEIRIVTEDPSRTIMPTILPICKKEELLEAREFARSIYCDPRLVRCAVSIAAATREHRGVELGVSPRGSIMLVNAARVYAMLNGRSYVIDQDIVDLAPLVFAHRLKMKDHGRKAFDIVREVTLAQIGKIEY